MGLNSLLFSLEGTLSIKVTILRQRKISKKRRKHLLSFLLKQKFWGSWFLVTHVENLKSVFSPNKSKAEQHKRSTLLCLEEGREHSKLLASSSETQTDRQTQPGTHNSCIKDSGAETANTGEAAL